MLRLMSIAIVAFLAAAPVGPRAGAPALPPAQPTDVEALIQKGLKAYKDGQTQEAVASLQAAIAMIQKSQQKGLAAFFPKAPEGWEAGEIKSNAMSYGTGTEAGSYSQINCQYTRKQDSLKVTVTLTDSPQLVEAGKAAAETYKNPELVKMLSQSGAGSIKPIDQQGWSGWMMTDKSQSQAQAFIKSYMLVVQVAKPDEAVLTTFWSAIDLKGLAGAPPTPASGPAVRIGK